MIEAAGYGIVVPAGVAAGVTWLLHRLLRDKAAGNFVSAAGLLCGFLAGYALATDGEWVPERNWHWLPLLALLAAIVGSIAGRDGASHLWRIALFPLLAIAAASCLVPEWTSRAIQVPGLGALLAALLLLFDPLPQRVAARTLVPLTCLCAFATAAFVAAKVSLTYGQLAGLAAAAFTGGSLVFWMQGETTRIRGLLPACVVLLEGAAYVGCIYPTDPIYGLLIAPAAPLVLWAFFRGPLSRLRGMRRTLCEYGLVLLVLIATAILLFAGSAGDSGSEW